MDTVSLWFDVKTLGLFGIENHTNEILPIGYGAAHALNKEATGNYYNYSSGSSSEKWGGAWDNKMSAVFASGLDIGNNLANKKQSLPYTTNGLKDFYDLKENNLVDVGPNMVVFLRKNRDVLKVQQTLDDNNANYNRNAKMTIEEQGSIAGGSLYGLSKAETYFSRPRDLWLRADTKREYGNLYNPYWQTRLIENIASEQAAVAAVQVVL
ncbi:MAG: hypothetical protein V5788_02480 [Shewanella sp.]